MTVDVIIPAYKPDSKFIKLMQMLYKQTAPVNKVIVMNTEENLFDPSIPKQIGEASTLMELHHITKAEFDHGHTRKVGASYSDAEFILFMTEDAIPYDEHLVEELLKPFSDSSVAAVYARQLPGENAGVLEAYARRYNYPDTDRKKTAEDLKELGIKTYFCSDVCACYRREVFSELGGFVDRTIFNEDMIFVSKLISAGYACYYAADAKVVHAHKYTNMQQLRRNFDNGVSQSMYAEVFEGVKSESEGMKFVKRAFIDLFHDGHGLYFIPFVISSAYKLYGFKMGKNYQKLSHKKIMKLTMSPDFFRRLWEEQK